MKRIHYIEYDREIHILLQFYLEKRIKYFAKKVVDKKIQPATFWQWKDKMMAWNHMGWTFVFSNVQLCKTYISKINFWHIFREKVNKLKPWKTLCVVKDNGHPVKKSPSLHGRKSNPNPKFIVTAKAYFVCHIDLNLQVSLIYAFIECP